MPSNFEAVKAFQEKFGLPVGMSPQTLFRGVNRPDEQGIITLLRMAETAIKQVRRQDDVVWGRVQMMLEELTEYAEAVVSGNLADQADSLVDLVYFALGTALTQGFPWEAIFTEVQRANMDKVRVESAGESHRLNKLDVKKPKGWQAPRIAEILEMETQQPGIGAALEAVREVFTIADTEITIGPNGKRIIRDHLDVGDLFLKDSVK